MRQGESLVVEKVGASLAHRRSLGRVTQLGRVGDPFVWDRGIDVLHRGVVERVMGVVKSGELRPIPRPTHSFEYTLGNFKRRLLRASPRFTAGTRLEFTSTYSGPKRAMYERHAVSLEYRPLERRDHRSGTFAKCEKTRKSPRVIIHDKPRRNIVLGQRLKLSEHRIFRAINKIFGYRAIMKGRTLEERGHALNVAWNCIPDAVGLLLDFSKYDVHHSTEALEFEHAIYCALFPGDEELRELLVHQLVTRAEGYCPDGKLRFTKRGMRTSGCMNTSLGNVLVVCAMLWSYMASLGIKYRLVNDGDDSVLIVSRRDVARIESTIQQWHLRLGFDLRIDGKADVLEEVVFCQSSPVFIADRWMMVRSPSKAVSNDLASTNIVDMPSARAHCAAVGTCGGFLSRGVPVMQAFYSAARRFGGHIDGARVARSTVYAGTGLFYQAKKADQTSPLCTPISDKTRVSFWLAFGITPAQQLSLEAAFDAEHTLGHIEDHRYPKYSQATDPSPESLHYVDDPLSALSYFLTNGSS